MSFCSLGFLVFFPVVFLLYYHIPRKGQWVLLLLASYYFYMCWKPAFILLILTSTCIDYISARMMEDHPKDKKIWLLVSVVSNLSLLFFFKYYGFFTFNVNSVFRFIGIPMSIPTLHIILPVGISFYTFQTMSYTIEVYRGHIRAERHFGYFALFVSYFPQLVAGPIETPQNLLPQLKKPHSFSYPDAVYGTKLMVWGFFKKLVVADTAAKFVDAVFNNVNREINGWTAAVAAFLFAIQVYCDFGGYSDIARGCSKIMGVDLMVNFKSPYFFSKSIKEYWTRNHISLSKWFTSYVYIPLGGSRNGLARKYVNNTITFLLSGLWHGADWTFVIWGGLQSVYINVGDYLRKRLRRDSVIVLPNPQLQDMVNTVVTCALSCFSLVFFRANNLTDAGIITLDFLRACAHPLASFSTFLHTARFGFAKVEIIYFPIMLLSLLVLFAFDYANEKCDAIARISTLPLIARWSLYVLIPLFILFGMQGPAGGAFIYFQF